jgi:L-ascorbate metabolism protein UlaG (beta-lactamase superfamily)
MDLYTEMDNSSDRIRNLDALIITHAHADANGGKSHAAPLVTRVVNMCVDDSVVLYQYSGVEEWLSVVKLACPFFLKFQLFNSCRVGRFVGLDQ